MGLYGIFFWPPVRGKKPPPKAKNPPPKPNNPPPWILSGKLSLNTLEYWAGNKRFRPIFLKISYGFPKEFLIERLHFFQNFLKDFLKKSCIFAIIFFSNICSRKLAFLTQKYHILSGETLDFKVTNLDLLCWPCMQKHDILSCKHGF